MPPLKNFIHLFALVFIMMPSVSYGADNKGTVIERIPFDTWLTTYRTEAGQAGITDKTLDAVLTFTAPLEEVMNTDKKQAEFVKGYWQYQKSALHPWRVKNGKKLLKKHKPMFDTIYKKYGVQGRYLVALWAMETNFGKYKGDIYTPHALASLAYEGRREDFFKEQLTYALKMVQEGVIKPKDFKGSWAGAFGHLQFMPKTFYQYAVDGDGDGKIDLINSVVDAHHSAANYLKSIGWDMKWRWGRQVTLKDGFPLGVTGAPMKRSLSMWRRMGVMDMRGKPISKGREAAAVLLPAGIKGPIMLVYGNFNLFLEWNTSLNYALSAGHLADKLADIDIIEPKNSSRTDRKLTMDEVKEIQTRLGVNEYYTWDIDGWIGRWTRYATRLYQADHNLPPDGYANADLLEHLRKNAKLPDETVGDTNGDNDDAENKSNKTAKSQ